MNITIKNGKTAVKLTKAEQRQLRASRDMLDKIGLLTSDEKLTESAEAIGRVLVAYGDDESNDQQKQTP